MDYDPVCFDIKSGNNRDYRIVKIDHEEIFCNNRIKVVSEIAPGCRALVLQTIERAVAVRSILKKARPEAMRNSLLPTYYSLAPQGFAGAGAAVEGAGADFWKSKFTLGAVRAPSSVLKYASLRVNPPKLATRLLGKSEM